MPKLIKAEWVPNPPVRDDVHVDLIRELMSYHCQCPASCRLVVDVMTGECVEFTKNAALAWSRIFEWPWAIANGELTKDSIVLDAGGGHAPLQYALAKRCLFVKNIDINGGFINSVEYMKQQLGLVNIEPTVEDITKMPDWNMDRVFCISVIEHIPDWQKAIDELFRVLKPGGFLILTMDVERHKVIEGKEFHIDVPTLQTFLRQYSDNFPGCERPMVNTMPNGSVLSCLCMKFQKEI